MTNEKIKVIMFSRRMNGFVFLIEEKKIRVSFYDERRKTKVMIYFEQNDQ
jgi:hypothetical protein